MKRSESIVKIAPALLKAQKLMGGAKKDASNPYFKSKYADLGAVLEACKELLNENDVVILQPHFSDEGKKFVETIFLHSSGEWVSSDTEIVVSKENDPQAQGSAITYARRYGLQSLISMPAEDDDGNAASNKKPASTGFAKASLVTAVPATSGVTTSVTTAQGSVAVTTAVPSVQLLTPISAMTGDASAEKPTKTGGFRAPGKVTVTKPVGGTSGGWGG